MSRESGCVGKVKHPSWEMANEMVALMRRSKREPKRRSKRLQAYRCVHCGEWHVGHWRLHPRQQEPAS